MSDDESEKQMCPRCEGSGRVEIHRSCQVEPWASLWKEEEALKPAVEGMHRVRCADCNGQGYR